MARASVVASLDYGWFEQPEISAEGAHSRRVRAVQKAVEAGVNLPLLGRA